MRIISGKFKSKRIIAPAHLPVRPTTDMAKESLFNILANHFYFEDIKALDLFAGTGNITYELASRGCEDITSVDINGLCTKFIYETTQKLGLRNVKIVHQNALEFLSKAYHKYNLIFADPPYEFEPYEEIIEKVFNRNLLTNDGLLIIEHSERKDFTNSPYFYDHRKYGSVHFSFFKPDEEEDDEEKKAIDYFMVDNQFFIG
ncbi:MAG: 16S rRNA (guanine(966)-N(2))-methyltransferase RsmD [Thermaurantimonas sp.]|uniref:16S rRNA (guanine(966)-N(2))-methyltransferase RsmD n=1 Tax=Thermaurantimonas sp. TaxID=2681568 RepID=UPI00391B3B9A